MNGTARLCHNETLTNGSILKQRVKLLLVVKNNKSVKKIKALRTNESGISLLKI